jgi:hypothetical protein
MENVTYVCRRKDWRERIDSTLAKKKAENDRQHEQNRIMHNISVALRATFDVSFYNRMCIQFASELMYFCARRDLVKSSCFREITCEPKDRL